MSKILVVYYSYSNTTRDLAEDTFWDGIAELSKPIHGSQQRNTGLSPKDALHHITDIFL